jgi:hypothetical protein
MFIEVPEAKLVIGDKIAVSKSKDLMDFCVLKSRFTPPVNALF